MRPLIAASVLAVTGYATHPVITGQTAAHAGARDVAEIRALLAPDSPELRLERGVWRAVSRICMFHALQLATKWPNHAMQLTAGRSAFPLNVTSKSNPQQSSLTPAVADLGSR